MSWWAALGSAAASASKQGGGGAPQLSDSDNGPVTVNVGGLNVPAFPNFPAYTNTVTGQSSVPQVQTQTVNQKTMLLWAVGLVGAVVLFKRLK